MQSINLCEYLFTLKKLWLTINTVLSRNPKINTDKCIGNRWLKNTNFYASFEYANEEF